MKCNAVAYIARPQLAHLRSSLVVPETPTSFIVQRLCFLRQLVANRPKCSQASQMPLETVQKMHWPGIEPGASRVLETANFIMATANFTLTG